MRNFFIIIMLFFTTSLCFAIEQETASFTDFLYWHTDACEYDNWVSHIAEGIASPNYNLYAPWDPQTNGFGDFHIASDEELEDWESVVESFVQENFEQAQSYINTFGFPYKVVQFDDTETGNTYYLLREMLNMAYYDSNGTVPEYDDEIGAFEYGWGLYVYNPQGTQPIVVTAPHPNDDFITSAVSYKCFKDWDAKFLLISGAGREVKWTEQGSYTNSKSLSDPSRVEDHPFTVAYKIFCDKIRDEFGQREFSPQIHSYDWNRHAGHSNCQISAGFHKVCPNLPIRDLSDLKIDIINASSHLMIPANTIGLHPDVYLNDYYAVHYTMYDFTFTDGDTTYTVNNQIDLQGYSQNRQMLYTFADWNRYDVFEPFFHLEMDELPNCYEQITYYLKWFYAYDTLWGIYNMEHLFDYTLEYYSYWIDAMTQVLPEVIALDDNLIPDTPGNFSIYSQGFDNITLEWERISSFDFNTYEILYSIEPIQSGNYDIYSREDNSLLASQVTDLITIPELDYNQQYYFKIRAKDYNDNYSELSNEVSAMTPPALISDFEAIGKDAQTTLQWIVQIQEGNQGFVVYRMGEVGFFEAIDSWETNPDLAGSPLPDVHYIFDDFDVTNGEYYYYKIAAVNTQGIEFMYNIQVGCSPRPIYNLFVSNFLGDITDSVAFSANPYASDYYDNNYDLYKSDSIPSEYIYAAFYEQGWGPEGAYLSQETHGYYEPIIDFKLWKLRVKTNQFNQPIKIFVSSNFPANFENLYLENYQTGQIVDLADSNMTFTTSNSDYLDFTLYWGYFEPQISFVSADNRIYQAGDTLSISWSTDFNILIEHFDISLQNNTDSLFVARNLSNTTTSYYWDIPDSITFHNANVILDAYLRNFEIIRVCSPYYLGVVPSQVTLLGDTNWSMISNPWPDEILEVSTVFGDSAELFSFNTEEEYISEVRFEFGKGYWLHVLDSFNYVDSASVQKTSFEILMHHGWNLIANPHLCIYNIKDLKFNLNSIEYSFSEMLSQCLISRAVYVYRDGSYQLVEYINPKESFLIYSYIEELSELSCIFLPYNIGAPILPLDLGWQLQLIATQEGSDGDDMVVGASESASDNYDFSYDLSEPPLKPFTDGLALYFPKDLQTDSLYLHDRLHWEYKEPLSETVPEEKIWNFALKISEINPVTFYSDFINIPDGYSVKMLLNDNEIDIIEDEIYIIVPNQTGILNGEMIIQNDLFVSCDKECPIAVELNNYPNPFKIKTNIVFFLPQSTNVKIEIYNIKGQLIKQFKIQSPIKLGTKFKIKEVVWDGRDENGNPVANGIYFCKLTSGDKSAVKKMILIK